MRTLNRLAVFALAVASLCNVHPAWSYDQLVEKKTFTLPSLTTVGGKTIKHVQVGYETYGTLNADGSNAIFIPHYFSGTSHAAGKYAATDPAPGYWDALIGPGKPLDTDKYFIVSADNLVNLNVKDPHVVTTGPASIDPDTGKPYGMTFPIVTFRDSVNVHKALVDALGVKHLQAVIGASGGSMLTMEWAASYPELVERAIPVIPGGLAFNPYAVEVASVWASAVTNDPKWNHGDYYGKDEPLQGVAEAMKMVSLSSRHYGWADRTFGRKPAQAGHEPIDSWDNLYAIEATFNAGAAAAAKRTDANSLLYTIKANQLFSVYQAADLQQGLQRIKARVLFIPAESDLLLFPDYSRQAMALLRAQGKQAELFELHGDGGHLDGITQIMQAGPAIRDFLSK
ncbi:homoserine O-acetyltransferase [Duganella sp. FT3S]|uniref:Probable acyltransferase n=1 Tax=Rugamonas fusca TaxID=2758568 RepID=A0A7W2I4Y6_9BURK|nr:homoserine O-acetyltransferase [Rugamonas fusca]MBA5603782.1 homoserine O-acetyltransferase [Rugamonas fusca]